MSTEITYILGNPLSGKSTLLRLLDGHPNLGVTPIHDVLINVFSHFDPNKETKDENNSFPFDLSNFREKLSLHTGYYYLEANQIGDPLTTVGASQGGDSHKYLDGFNFYEFEREWVTKISEKTRVNQKQILLTILKSLFSQWGSYKFSKDKCKYVIGLGFCNEDNLKNLLTDVPNSKVIVLQRDPRGIVAANKVNGSVDQLLSRGDLFRWMEYNKFVQNMESKYKNRIHIVSFNDLISNTSKTMKHISEFLNIPRERILNHPTFAGEKLEKEKYIGQINDDWRDILNKREKNIAGLQMNMMKKHNANITELNTYVKSKLYHNFRPYIQLGEKGLKELKKIN